MGPEPIGGLFLRALPMGLRGRANGRELHADPRTDWLFFSGCRAGVRDGSHFLAPRRKTRASLEAITPQKHFKASRGLSQTSRGRRAVAIASPMSRGGGGGEMTGDVEYGDGRVRRFRMSRDGSGE